MRYLRFISPHLSRVHETPFQIPNFKFPNLSHRQFTSAPQPEQSAPSPPPSEKVSAIVDEFLGLTLLEVSDLTEVLWGKLGIKEMTVMAVMMPGMGFSGMGGGGAGAGGKVEKTVFDVKLEGFDAALKIKVIKEVRSFTNLGLKEAKDLVEKAPSLVKKSVT